MCLCEPICLGLRFTVAWGVTALMKPTHTGLDIATAREDGRTCAGYMEEEAVISLMLRTCKLSSSWSYAAAFGRGLEAR